MSPGLEQMLAVMFFVAVAAGVGVRLNKNQSSTLVLQKFTIARNPLPESRPTVEIIGRLQGIIAFLLSLMGFSPTTRFTIAGTELRCRSSSFFGERSHFIPLRRVSGLAAGVHKPISSLVFAAICFVFGAYLSMSYGSWEPLAFAIVISGALLTSYVLSKKFFIEIYSMGGPPIMLLFKPNVLEGVPIDVNQALSVVGVIRDLVFEQGHSNELERVDSATDDRADALSNQNSYSVERVYEEENYEELANELFAEARQLVQAGNQPQAIEKLQEIVHNYPATQAATRAIRTLQKHGIHE